MRDGDIDYSRYTLRELEEALAGIDVEKYPQNHANLISAYVRLTESLPPERAMTLASGVAESSVEVDVFGDPLPQPTFDEGGRYVPNDISGSDRLTSIGISLLLLGYGTYGIWVNDLYVPTKRSSVHLRDSAAWVMYGAIVCACLVMLSVVIDHYDRRNNERSYRAFANTFKGMGYALLVMAFVIHMFRAGGA